MSLPEFDPTILRVLPFERADGAYQLAATEAVIDAVGSGDAPPTLRMYSWAQDALILGIGQRSDQVDLAACRSSDCVILRRISGGTGVYHDQNTVSFQLVLPAGHPHLSGDIHKNYRLISGIVVDMLATIGVEARAATLEEAREDSPPPGLDAICFSSLAPFEVLSDGRKLVGLAQVRRRTVSALQGMLYLKLDPAKSVDLLIPNAQPRERLTSVLAGRTTDVSRAARRDVGAREVVSAFRQAALRALGAQPVDRPMTGTEIVRARELKRTRYGNPEWTFRK